MNYKQTTLKVSIYPECENPVFGESATHVSIDDEAGGGFITLTQSTDDGDSVLRFEIEELRIVLQVAEKLIGEYNDNHNDQNR